MTEHHLKIRMSGVHAADLFRKPRSGMLSIRYVQSWLDNPKAIPLSVRMPLSESTYQDSVASPFVAGLLPDSKAHRKMIGKALGVDADSDFSLIESIGRECAGAISIVGPDEEDQPELSIIPQYDVLSESQTAKLIRELPKRPLLVDNGEIRLSLAGVNDKAAVIQVNGQIAMPMHGTPSTHILKIDISNLPGSARTEHFCLRLAALAGIATPKSRISEAEDQVYLLVSRYDRKMIAHTDGPRLRRLHQEDFCQALGYAPDMKYEVHGGPNWKESFELVTKWTNSANDRMRLLDAALFQWFVDNPDAHAKNYSLIHADGRTVLAPIYDINNAPAFYEHFKEVRPHLAMSVGGARNPREFTGGNWDLFAHDVKFPTSVVRGKILNMAQRLPDLALDLANSLRNTPAWTPLLMKVVDDVSQRCAGVPQMLSRKTAVTTPAETPAEERIFSK